MRNSKRPGKYLSFVYIRAIRREHKNILIFGSKVLNSTENFILREFAEELTALCKVLDIIRNLCNAQAK